LKLKNKLRRQKKERKKEENAITAREIKVFAAVGMQ